MNQGISVLVPIKITGDMIKAGTSINEPDTTPAQDETAWVSGATYAVKVERVSSNRIWSSTQAHSGRTKPPELDPDYWNYMRPSNRHAPFDDYTSTAAKAVGSLTYVMQPGIFVDVALFGVVADRALIRVQDGPDGPVLKEVDVDMWEQALGLWELLFSPLGMSDQLALNAVPISAQQHLTVKLTGGAAATVSLGTMHVGEWVSLTGGPREGGTEYGAEAEPKSYSYIEGFPDGSWKIQKGHVATNVDFSGRLPAAQAQYVTAILRRILDVPVAIRATDLPEYSYLSTVGLVSGRVRAINRLEAQVTIKAKGAI